MTLEVGRVSISVLDGASMSLAPRLVVQCPAVDRRAEPCVHRHGEPAGPGGGLDAITVLPAVLLVLHGVEEHEHVGCGPLGQVAQPWQVVRLVDPDGRHRNPLWGRTKIGLLSTPSRAPPTSPRRTTGQPSLAPRGPRRSWWAPSSPRA